MGLDHAVSVAELRSLTGLYCCRHRESSDEFTVELVGDSLEVHDYPGFWPKDYRLIAKSPDVFFFESFPFEMVFTRGSNRCAVEASIVGPTAHWSLSDEPFKRMA